MKARIIITPEGQIAFFIDEGTYEEAKPRLEKLIADLGAAGLQLSDIGGVEQHRHDHQHAHIAATNNAHN